LRRLWPDRSAGDRLQSKLKKQDGSPWLGDGEVADDGTLLGMNFYVEGIEGAIPN